MYMNKYFFAMSDDDNQDWLQDMFEIFKQLPDTPQRPQTPIMDEEILEIMTVMGMNVAEMQSVMRSEI
jgi:hypothetical protein